MTTKEYVKTAQKARALLLEAYVEFVDGDDHLKACDKLWQAAAHSILALSRLRLWPLGSHSRMRENADRLAVELGESHISTDFDAAERFHANFYHDYMSASDINVERPLVHRFVSRVLALPELRGLTS